MAEYYYDIEVGYTDPEIIRRLRTGGKTWGKASFDPLACKIITIQYQALDRSGRGIGPLKILKEWECSEELIIKEFSKILNPKRVWDFIPVGYNIYFDLGMFRRRAEVYGIYYDEWFIYHNLPCIDIKHICLAMNNFQFKGCGLDKFTGKEHSGAIVPVWYHDHEYEKIINYVEKEAREFILFYQKLKQKMPEFRRWIKNR
ncbi:MAG: hypothetical protein DRO76_02180 [Candidatus Altiarchaeales archaeon]|nr:MAG: hypothetical protein DRO76_02180 [Candidatus Altiarchaeales archaeon]